MGTDVATYVEREKRRAREQGRQMNWPLVGFVFAFALLSSILNDAIDAIAEYPREVECAGVLWGEPSGGLRAGIECVEASGDWDHPEIRLHLRNDGAGPARIVHIAVLLHLVDAEPIEVRRDEEVVPHDWRASYGGKSRPETRWFEVLPAGATMTGSKHLVLRQWGLDKDYEVEVRFVYEWRESSVEGVNDEREPVTIAGLWTGRVESRPITVRRGLPGWPGRLLRIGVGLAFIGLMALASRMTRRWYQKPCRVPEEDTASDDVSAAPPSRKGASGSD